jgi:acyl-CoA synthetase (AMP-forming)/AMP-acid ligase II
MQGIVTHLHADTESVTDVEQLFSTVVKASKRIACNHQVRSVSPLTILVSQMMREPTGKSELLLLRLLQFSLTSNSGVVSADSEGIKLDKTQIFRFENMKTFILSADASVVTCAVVAKQDDKWGETPLAFVELHAGHVVDAESLKAHCKSLLAGYKVPRTFVFEAIPKTATGKIQKFQLREKAKAL